MPDDEVARTGRSLSLRRYGGDAACNVQLCHTWQSAVVKAPGCSRSRRVGRRGTMDEDVPPGRVLVDAVSTGVVGQGLRLVSVRLASRWRAGRALAATRWRRRAPRNAAARSTDATGRRRRRRGAVRVRGPPATSPASRRPPGAPFAIPPKTVSRVTVPRRRAPAARDAMVEDGLRCVTFLADFLEEG